MLEDIEKRLVVFRKLFKEYQAMDKESPKEPILRKKLLESSRELRKTISKTLKGTPVTSLLGRPCPLFEYALSGDFSDPSIFTA